MAGAAAIFTSQQAWTSDAALIYAGRRSPANVSGTAFGWSGYAIERGQRYSSAAGSWIVPRVSYQNYAGYSQAEFSSTWVGIGGDGNDQTLIQLGTTQNIDASGTSKYYAWYLLVSALSVPATEIPLPVEPGDKIIASIKCVANCIPDAQQSWMMTMTNSTKGWTWNNNGVPFSYKSSMVSAEWIMEDPILQGPGALPKLPKYGSVTFTDITANDANPNLSLATDAITMVAPDGSPTSIPTAAANGNSFTVNQVGLPPAVPLPNQPTFTSCTSATTDLGPLGSQTAAGQFSGFGQEVYFRFYLAQYESITAFPLAQSKFSYLYVDDNTGAQLAARHGTEQAPIFVSLDPGYYCLKVFNPSALGVQFQVQMSGQAKGLRPGTTKQTAPPVAALDIGNLTPNGYYEKSRYINDGNVNVKPLLAPGHIYTLRDWVGGAGRDQFYVFSLDANRRVSIELANLYLGARATIETEGGGIVAETVESGIPLGPRPPSQKFEGLLPAGTYYLHVAFAGVGGPGTPYAIALTAQ
jgi:hypothetical protein